MNADKEQDERTANTGSGGEVQRRRRHSRRSSLRDRRSKHAARKHETIGERVNRQFLQAGTICISVVLIAAAYLLGREHAVKTASPAATVSQSAAKEPIAATSTATKPALDEGQLAALDAASAKRLEGDVQGFIESLNSMAVDSPTPAWLNFERARAARQTGDRLTALSLLSQTAGKPLPPDPKIAEFEATLRLEGGDYQRSTMLLDEALLGNPGSWQLRLTKSDIVRKSGKLAEGFQLARQARLYGDEPWAKFVLDVKYHLAGVEAGDAAILEAIDEGLTSSPELLLWQIAGAAAALTRDDSAQGQALLTKARSHLDPALYLYFTSDTAFDFFRLDPRFADLL